MSLERNSGAVASEVMVVASASTVLAFGCKVKSFWPH